MRLWPFSSKPTVPVVRLQGVIGSGSALRPGLSLAAVDAALAKAFAMKAPVVALAINSPGGSAAQSSLIAGRVRALADEHDTTVLAFVEDVAASGGYWLAVAADEIFADATSIVGSIGVVTASFGFTELIEKIGVERRIYTVGENKAILDPFQPEKESDIAIIRALQADIHAAFVAAVKARRGSRLGHDPDLFTGRVWSGTGALALGLVDGLGDIRSVLRERFGKHVRLKQVPLARPSFLRSRLGVGLGAEELIGAIRSDRLWDRYGL